MLTAKEKMVIEKVISEISHFLDIHCKEQERLVTLTRREYIITIRWNNTNKAFDVEKWRYGSCIETSTMSIDKLVATLLYITEWDYGIYYLECQVNNEKFTCICPKIEQILLDEYYRDIRKEDKINSELDKNLIKGESTAKYFKEKRGDNMTDYYMIWMETDTLIHMLESKDTRKVVFAKEGRCAYLLYKINDNDFDLISTKDQVVFTGSAKEIVNKLMPEIIKGEVNW